jgi:F-type H+-transporting ATPase subunit b
MTTAIVLVPAEGGGFNPLDFTQIGIMIWTWIIFLAALPFIWKVVMGPISRSMLARDEKVTAAIAAAESAKTEAERARVAVEASLAEARTEAAKTVEAARGRAEVREREILGEAKAASEKLLEHARSEIRSEQAKAVAQIRAQVVDLSLAAAGKVLERKVDAADDRRLVEQLVAAAGSPAAAKAPAQPPPHPSGGRG